MSPEQPQHTTDALLDHVKKIRIAECAFLSGLGSARDVGRLRNDYRLPAPTFSGDQQPASNADRLCMLCRLDFHLEREVEPLETRWSTLLEDTVLVAGTPMRYPDLVAAARTADLREQRKTLSLAIAQIANKGRALKQDAWRRRLGICCATGHGVYASIYARLKSHNVATMISLANEVLRGTQRTYERLLERAIDATGLDCSDGMSLEDMDWMLRSLCRLQDRNAVSTNRVMQDVLLRLAGERAGAIRLDLAERPGKSTRPFAAPIDPPGDVRISARPSGSLRDLVEGLHELGHACAFAWIDPYTTSVEKMLSWDDVQETYAFLASGLARDPSFWRRMLGSGQKESEDASFNARLAELYLVRRYAAKTLFELEMLMSGEVSDRADELYDRLLYQATGIHQSAGRWLIDTDTSLMTLDYFAAWLIAAQLERTLAARDRNAWWLDEQALRRIRMVWMKGGAATKQLLLELAGAQDIEADALIASFNG